MELFKQGSLSLSKKKVTKIIKRLRNLTSTESSNIYQHTSCRVYFSLLKHCQGLAFLSQQLRDFFLLTIKEKQPLSSFQRKRLYIVMKVLSFRYNNSYFFCTSHKALERITPLITDSKLLTICCFYQIVCIHEVTSQKVLA